MNIAVIGLGLIGGSMAKTIKKLMPQHIVLRHELFDGFCHRTADQTQTDDCDVHQRTSSAGL